MIRGRSRPGYIFLISVLFVGVISLATTVSLLLLGWAAEESSFTQAQSTQAVEWARTCIEHSLLEMRKNESLEYTGESLLVFPGTSGSCEVHVDGAGNIDRTICAKGIVESFNGTTTRRLVAHFSTLFPLAVVDYKEVLNHPLCDQLSPRSSASSSVSSTQSSGGGFCGGGNCIICANGGPLAWTMTVENVTTLGACTAGVNDCDMDAVCSECPNLNGTFTLEQSGPGSGCAWTNLDAGMNGECTNEPNWSVYYDGVSNDWRLVAYGGNAAVYYRLNFAPDCSSVPRTFSLLSNGTSCTNVPASITLTPVLACASSSSAASSTASSAAASSASSADSSVASSGAASSSSTSGGLQFSDASVGSSDSSAAPPPPPPASSSDSSGGLGGSCPMTCGLPSTCNSFPLSFTMSVSGIAPSLACPSCAERDGDYTLNFNSFTCRWEASSTESCDNEPRWYLKYEGGEWRLYSGASGYYIRSNAGWDCGTDQTFTLAGGNTLSSQCMNWPASVTLTPAAARLVCNFLP